MARPDKRAIQVRLSGEDLERLDAWRRCQDQIPPSSEALRLLLRRALRDVDRKVAAAVRQRGPQQVEAS
jgi:hypothetical protein